MRKGSVSIGTTLGRLTVIDKTDGAAGKHQRLICQCSCGSIRDVASHNFKAGKHCSCLVAEKTLVGRTYGKVEVIELLAKNSEIKGKRGHLYKCKCTQCATYYNYPTNAILRKGFTGCRCVSDTTQSSKKAIYSAYKTNAKKRCIEFDFEIADFVILAEQKCFYCGCLPSNKINSKELVGEWEYNGIDRIDNNKPYIKENLVPCCKKCNFFKSNHTKKDFLDHVKIIYEYNKLQDER